MKNYILSFGGEANSSERWVYTYNDPLYEETEPRIFSSEKEAIERMASDVQAVAGFASFEEFKKAINAISEAIKNKSEETGDDYADELAFEFCMGYGCEYEGAGYADDHYVCLPETKYGGLHKWEICSA